MSIRITSKVIAVAIECDKPGCNAVLADNNPVDSRQWRASQMIEREAKAQGWSRWIGRRTARVYCPEHGPSAKADMWHDW